MAIMEPRLVHGTAFPNQAVMPNQLLGSVLVQNNVKKASDITKRIIAAK